jgi:hypothetical protein
MLVVRHDAHGRCNDFAVPMTIDVREPGLATCNSYRLYFTSRARRLRNDERLDVLSL